MFGAFGLSWVRQGRGILQVWLPAGVLYVSPHSSRLMTGQQQVGTRSSPWARTCVVGQKTIADVPGIPKPDTKLLAGCRERGRSQVFYIMRSLLPVLPLGAPQRLGPPFPEVLRIRKPACVSVGPSGAPAVGFVLLRSVSVQAPWLSTGCGGPRGSQGVPFHPDVPWCWGWKRNWAAGLKGTESSHPALFPWLAPFGMEFCLGGSSGRLNPEGVFLHPAWKVEAGRGKVGLGGRQKQGVYLGESSWRQRPVVGGVVSGAEPSLWGWKLQGAVSQLLCPGKLMSLQFALSLHFFL